MSPRDDRKVKVMISKNGRLTHKKKFEEAGVTNVNLEKDAEY